MESGQSQLDALSFALELHGDHADERIDPQLVLGRQARIHLPPHSDGEQDERRRRPRSERDQQPCTKGHRTLPINDSLGTRAA